MFTVGHSTHSFGEFVGLLHAHGVAAIVDVRKLPRSRRHPQFSIDTLPSALAAEGIEYTHAAALGGLRRGQHDSVNRAWRNASFRAFADYMQTPEFAHALDALALRAATTSLALMCAERLWWRCHRSLIADVAVASGIDVRHITDAMHTQRHALRSWARVDNGRVWYPADDEPFASSIADDG